MYSFYGFLLKAARTPEELIAIGSTYFNIDWQD